jgi:hypothetical protein
VGEPATQSERCGLWEPWQARHLRLPSPCHGTGISVGKEWAAALADELKAKRLSEAAALIAKKDAWAEAYRRTPHGKPVDLPNEPI